MGMKEESRRDIRVNNTGYPNADEVRLGCIMRIADALEAISVNSFGKNRDDCCQQIIKERDEARREWDSYRSLYKNMCYWNRRHSASNHSLRGWITRYKKQIKALKETRNENTKKDQQDSEHDKGL